MSGSLFASNNRVAMLVTTTVLSVVLAGAAMGVVTSGASAATCPSTYACGWVNSNFGSSRGQWAGNNAHLSVFGNSNCQTGNWNDCISSDANSGTSCVVHFWTDWGYAGTIHSIGMGSFEGGLGGLNDEFSSNNWC
jgi:hypothetical protein